MAEETTIEKKEKTTADKTTETSKKAHLLIRQYYKEANEALESGKPVAWMMGGTLCDPLIRAMDVVPIYTENFGGTAAAMKGGMALCEACESDGFSDCICGYARVGLGHTKLREQLGCVDPAWPNGGMADPSILVGCSLGCEPRYKWYQAQRRYQSVPFICTEIFEECPVGVDPDEVEDVYIKLLVEELYEAKATLEKHLQKKMDMDLVMKYVDQSEKTKNMWWKCDEIRRHVPAPMPVEDMLSCMPFGSFYAAYEESEQFFKELYAECEERIKDGQGVIPDERFRILWGWGLPPWHYMRIFNYLEEKGAVPVIQQCYTNLGQWDCSQYTDPFERIARYQWRYRNSPAKKANELRVPYEIATMIRFIEEFQCDGVIQHALVSCRLKTIGQLASTEMIKNITNVPVMSFQSDIVDERTFDHADTNKRIDAFLEAALVAKEKRQRGIIA